MKNLTSILVLGATGLVLAVNGCSRTIERNLTSQPKNQGNIVRYDGNNDPFKREDIPKSKGKAISSYDFDENLKEKYPTIKLEEIEEREKEDFNYKSSFDQYHYGTFRKAIGPERLAHLKGHLREVATDLIRSFYKVVEYNVPELKDDLCNSLNSEKDYNILQQQKQAYENFNPENYAKISLWEPIRDENGKISEKDKKVYFIISNNKLLRKRFFETFEIYNRSRKLIEKELAENLSEEL